MASRAKSLLAVLAVLPFIAPAGVLAESSHGSDTAPDIQKTVEEYCVAVSDAAAERRTARQALALQELRSKVEERIARLEQAKTELEALIKRREDLRALADQELVGIYAGMAPETAAAQMEKIGPTLAASVLRQLKPRQASAILNEMKPELAARLVNIIASVSQNSRDKK